MTEMGVGQEKEKGSGWETEGAGQGEPAGSPASLSHTG